MMVSALYMSVDMLKMNIGIYEYLDI